jgi:hypothetical protein
MDIAKLGIGDILVASWGYDQTNIDYYEVVEVPSKCFVVIKQVKNTVESSEIGADYVVPTPGDYTGPAMRKQVQYSNEGLPRLKIYSWGVYARLWTGGARYQTGYGYGH